MDDSVPELSRNRIDLVPVWACVALVTLTASSFPSVRKFTPTLCLLPLTSKVSEKIMTCCNDDSWRPHPVSSVGWTTSMPRSRFCWLHPRREVRSLSIHQRQIRRGFIKTMWGKEEISLLYRAEDLAERSKYKQFLHSMILYPFPPSTPSWLALESQPKAKRSSSASICYSSNFFRFTRLAVTIEFHFFQCVSNFWGWSDKKRSDLYLRSLFQGSWRFRTIWGQDQAAESMVSITLETSQWCLAKFMTLSNRIARYTNVCVWGSKFNQNSLNKMWANRY